MSSPKQGKTKSDREYEKALALAQLARKTRQAGRLHTRERSALEGGRQSLSLLGGGSGPGRESNAEQRRLSGYKFRENVHFVPYNPNNPDFDYNAYREKRLAWENRRSWGYDETGRPIYRDQSIHRND